MRRQRGVAAVTAILIVAVAASAAALMLSQQSAMIDQALMVSSRAQADLYAQAGLDWARGVLAEDSRRAKDVDSLDEGWAQPIAALPVDRATVAGAITDEQGKVNLNNLAPDGQRSDPDLRIFRTLLGSLGLSPDLADAVLDWIDRDSEPRHFFGLRFNLNVCRCHLSRFAQAQAGLDELRALTPRIRTTSRSPDPTARPTRRWCRWRSSIACAASTLARWRSLSPT